jgi:hypothetical protein
MGEKVVTRRGEQNNNRKKGQHAPRQELEINLFPLFVVVFDEREKRKSESRRARRNM